MRNDQDDDYGIEPLQPGDPERIGDYRLLGLLGAGGMGRVFLARSPGGRTVAVKTVHEQLAADTAFRARFRREVKAARRVSEEFTAPVLDAEPEGRSPWVATGYVAGPSLEQVVRTSGPLRTDAVLGLAGGLARALAGIHEAGIVHRDLKPSNVMLTVHGPKIIDFGIARALQTTTSTESLLTGTGLVIGSPGFMAPEQVIGDEVGPEADVFALGCLLMYAASGRLPFGSGAVNRHSVMYRVVESPPDLEPVEDDGLRGLIAACLTKPVSERPDLDAVLEHIVEARGEGADDGAESGGAAGAAAWLPPEVVARIARQTAAILDRELPPVRSGEQPKTATGSGADDAEEAGGDAEEADGPPDDTAAADPADPADLPDSADDDGPDIPTVGLRDGEQPDAGRPDVQTMGLRADDAADADEEDVRTVGLRAAGTASEAEGAAKTEAVGEAVPTPDDEAPKPEPPPPPRRKWTVAAAVLAVLLIAGSVALLQRDNGKADASGKNPGGAASSPGASASSPAAGESDDKSKDKDDGKSENKEKDKEKEKDSGEDEDGDGRSGGSADEAASGEGGKSGNSSSGSDGSGGSGSSSGSGSGDGGGGSGSGGGGGGDDPPSGGGGSSGSVPKAFVGTWTRAASKSSSSYNKVVVHQASAGETVMTFTRDIGNSCSARASLVDVLDGGAKLSVGNATAQSGSCATLKATTWDLNGGELRMKNEFYGYASPFQKAG